PCTGCLPVTTWRFRQPRPRARGVRTGGALRAGPGVQKPGYSVCFCTSQDWVGGEMGERRTRDVFLEVLESEGVSHVFGNPGTTELPFIDALAGQTSIEYVLALQEASAVGMADGYAQVTRRPAFLNLHTSAGLGNAIGNLTNARANGTPLVVTAGNADRRHLIADPLLSGDLVGLARGVSKWGHEVRHPEE